MRSPATLLATCATLTAGMAVGGAVMPTGGAGAVVAIAGRAGAVMPIAMSAGATSSTPLPTHGVQPWGTWRHTDDLIELQLVLPDDVKSADLCCEVFDGWLAVFVDASYTSMYEDGVWGGEREVEVAPDGPPLLFGRLAQLVLPPSLDYDVVEDEDGRRVVKVELKKASTELPVPLSSGSPCIFDETLMLSGEACAVPGLSVEHNEASRLEP